MIVAGGLDELVADLSREYDGDVAPQAASANEPSCSGRYVPAHVVDLCPQPCLAIATRPTCSVALRTAGAMSGRGSERNQPEVVSEGYGQAGCQGQVKHCGAPHLRRLHLRVYHSFSPSTQARVARAIVSARPLPCRRQPAQGGAGQCFEVAQVAQKALLGVLLCLPCSDQKRPITGLQQNQLAAGLIRHGQ